MGWGQWGGGLSKKGVACLGAVGRWLVGVGGWVGGGKGGF